MLIRARLRIPILVTWLMCAAPAFAAGPRVFFARTIPARHDLGGAENVTLLYAIGDSDKITTFIAVLMDQTNQSSTLRATDATERGPRLVGERPDAATIKRIRRVFPADVYLSINKFTCDSKQVEAERGVRDVDGERVRRKQLWIDAVCSARIDVLDGTNLQRLFSYAVRGEGTSPRVEEVTDEVRDVALEQAARYAAVEASESITPRVIRDSIPLDPAAPSFEQGMSMVEVARYEDARGIWERALRQNEKSAALHYNLAVVSEVIGNHEAAGKYFSEARRLAPNEPLYKIETRRFVRRVSK